MQSAFIDIGTEKNGFIHLKDILPKVDEKMKTRIKFRYKKVIKPNQKLLVQIKKIVMTKKVQEFQTYKSTWKIYSINVNTDFITISQKNRR